MSKPRGREAGAPRWTGGSRAVDPDVQHELQKFATEFLIFVSPKGELVSVAGTNTLGYDGDERAGHHIAEHIHPDDLPKIFDVIERVRRTTGFDERVVARARHKDGSWRVFDARVFDASLKSNLKGSVLRVRDITEEVESPAEGPAPETEQVDRFLSLAEVVPLGILSADARGWVAYSNAAAQKIFGLADDLLNGDGWEKVVLDADRPSVAQAMAETLQTESQRKVTFRVVDGISQRWVHAKFVPVSSHDTVTGWIATIEDITDQRRLESELSHRATHDPLTSLPNRLLLEDRLRQATGRLRRDSTSITVLFIDLDGFKEINDTLGHKAGDEVLVEVGRRLRGIMRDVDTVARLGGDEFVAICESLPQHEADEVVERIVKAFEEPLLVDGQSLRVGASIGVSRTNDPLVDVVDLLAVADQSMYRDKQRRKAAGPA